MTILPQETNLVSLTIYLLPKYTYYLKQNSKNSMKKFCFQKSLVDLICHRSLGALFYHIYCAIYFLCCFFFFFFFIVFSVFFFFVLSVFLSLYCLFFWSLYCLVFYHCIVCFFIIVTKKQTKQKKKKQTKQR
jgi:magnesium-transporting ATPase (P-type)